LPGCEACREQAWLRGIYSVDQEPPRGLSLREFENNRQEGKNGKSFVSGVRMSCQLVGSNVVIAAHQFNPSLVSQPWLIKNGLATEDDFRSGYIFTDSLVQFQARTFSLVLVEEQLQFHPKTDQDREKSVIEQVIGSFVSQLPHTPYKAVGLNFFWTLVPDTETVRELSKRLFYRPEIPVFQNFASDDARFGVYLSKGSLGCRLKLEVKPVVMQSPKDKKEFLHFSFNYNMDIEEEVDPVVKIKEVISQWDEAKRESAAIVKSAESEHRE
jgi:hypothetical protein